MQVTKKVIKSSINLQAAQPNGLSSGKDATTLSQAAQKQLLLDKLYEPFKNCTQCPLGTLGRSKVVFGSGNPNARLLFVGEAPGRDEDAQGLPFVGRAGQLLTKIIEAMGLARSDVYIANVVKCRPPENRAPTPLESGTCKDLMLYKQIDIINPIIICTLGSIATQGLLGPTVAISKVRGTFQHYKNYLVVPTFHPAYLLRNPEAKKYVWDDVQKIMAKLKEV